MLHAFESPFLALFNPPADSPPSCFRGPFLHAHRATLFILFHKVLAAVPFYADLRPLIKPPRGLRAAGASPTRPPPLLLLRARVRARAGRGPFFALARLCAQPRSAGAATLAALLPTREHQGASSQTEGHLFPWR